MTSPDRDLLFGLLAVQTGFITRDALARGIDDREAASAPLGELLVARGDLDPVERDLLEPIVERHLKKHGGDPQSSLASLRTDVPAVDSLATFVEAAPKVQASFSRVLPGAPWSPTAAGATVPARGAGALRFRIIRPHAKGGLGEVFLAVDRELGRTVALKEIQHRHLDQPSLRTRFVLEAEVTGNLEHPGIVPVYALGSHPDGRPYYVMRFIQGESLKEAVDRFHREAPTLAPSERALRLRQLLGRFVDVCDAVAYAHSRGVLHRDLKPANVMLGKFGETLVVDWGLAKVVDRTGADPSPELTESALVPPSGDGSEATVAGTVLGTHGFMSPEQAEGRADRLDARTDVYSLGAVLQCLLTGGSRPGDAAPSGSTSAVVPRPLAAVCRKAMSQDLADRYPSARALADDVEQWLADEPVSAWREPTSTRVRRWAARHRPLVAASVVGLAVALAGSVAVAVVQAQGKARLEEANKLAKRRADLTLELVDVLQRGTYNFRNAFHDASLRKRRLDQPGQTPPATSSEARAAFFRGIRELAEGETGDSPDALARRARSHAILGSLADEMRLANEAHKQYEQAKDLLEGVLRREPNEPDFKRALAHVCEQLAGLDEEGEEEEVALLRRARALLSELVRDHAAVPEYRGSLADVNDAIASRGESLSEEESRKLEEESRVLREGLLRDGYPESREFPGRQGGAAVGGGFR